MLPFESDKAFVISGRLLILGRTRSSWDLTSVVIGKESLEGQGHFAPEAAPRSRFGREGGIEVVVVGVERHQSSSVASRRDIVICSICYRHAVGGSASK